MNNKVYEYDGIIHEIPEKGGAYVEFPWNIREEFQKGRVKVHATFDGIAYDGDGSICYIIGILKSIRTKLKKGEGDSIHVVIQQRT